MRLYMTELTVNDFPFAVGWYTRLLGVGPSLLDEPNGFALFEVAGGRVAVKRGSRPGGSTVHFEVTDLTEELARLGSDEEVKESPEGYRRAKLHDPDGNAVVLFEWV